MSLRCPASQSNVDLFRSAHLVVELSLGKYCGFIQRVERISIGKTLSNGFEKGLIRIVGCASAPGHCVSYKRGKITIPCDHFEIGESRSF